MLFAYTTFPRECAFAAPGIYYRHFLTCFVNVPYFGLIFTFIFVDKSEKNWYSNSSHNHNID